MIETPEGEAAARFNLAELYVKALKNLADQDKNLVIKANLNDPGEMINKSMKMLNEEEVDKTKEALQNVKSL